MSEKYKYTLDGSFENAYHDCKLVAESIIDDQSFQDADTGLILGYMDRILEALEKQIPKKPISVTAYNGEVGECCPACGLDNSEWGMSVCVDCGQRLYWWE